MKTYLMSFFTGIIGIVLGLIASHMFITSEGDASCLEKTDLITFFWAIIAVLLGLIVVWLIEKIKKIFKK